ncbi:hypothetical protein MVEN_02376200 [Mycena venus]|uniref:Uncharacterized protein n=1 Tax=Mycena venus TaxID=2733690 RepID=A0A8H6X2B1_9AGAR|nr:hypothetical protein MVEN_02376200 [Mycena venus]
MPYLCCRSPIQKLWACLLLHSSVPSSHSMSNYTIDTHSFDTYYYTALLQTFGTCQRTHRHSSSYSASILLVLLFNTTYLLHTRIRASRGWLISATCAMGLFAALQLGLQIATTVLFWRFFYLGVQGDGARASSVLSQGDVLDVVGDYLLVANNIVTDGLFIHRCYVLWGRNIKVVIVPALSLVVTAVMGSVGASEPDEIGRADQNEFRLAFGMIVLTNLTLMGLTAGRVWWIRRDVVTILEPSVTRTYDTVIAMILESGAIYCISIVLYLISVVRLNKQDSLPAISVFRAAIPQIMNIAPVLILVRVGSGCSIGDGTSSSGVLESSCWRDDPHHSLVMRPANIRHLGEGSSALEGLGR